MICSPIAHPTNAVQNVLDRLQRVKATGPDKWQACCPAHEDKQASLSVGVGREGNVLLKCFAGCSVSQICETLAVPLSDLFFEKRQPASPRRLVATYDYTDATGKLLYQVCRYDPKDFRQRRPDGDVWSYSLKGIARVLYRLPEVLAAVQGGETLFLPEGEKDCENLRALGLTATTNAQGAAQPFTAAYADTLRGADVVILPDNDEAGRLCRDARIKALLRTAKRIRVLDLPGLAEHGDVSDWLAAGGTKAELLRLAELAPDVSPLDATMQGVLAGLSEALQGLPLLVEANGLPTLHANAKPGEIKAALYRADTFGKRANVVVNLFIGALAVQAGNVRGWTDAVFGQDAGMSQHVRQCKMVFLQWHKIFDVNKHDLPWSVLLLGSRKIFHEADRREMVTRAKPPTGPELTAEIKRRKAEQNGGNVEVSPKQRITELLKLLTETRGEEFADAQARRAVALLESALMVPQDAAEDAVSEAEKETVFNTLLLPTYTLLQSQSAPDLPEVCCNFTTKLPEESDDAEEFCCNFTTNPPKEPDEPEADLLAAYVPVIVQAEYLAARRDLDPQEPAAKLLDAVANIRRFAPDPVFADLVDAQLAKLQENSRLLRDARAPDAEVVSGYDQPPPLHYPPLRLLDSVDAARYAFPER